MAKIFIPSASKLDTTQKRVFLAILLVALPLFLLSLSFIQETAEVALNQFAKEEAHHIEKQILTEIEHYLQGASAFTKEASAMLKLNPTAYRKVIPFLRHSVESNAAVYGSALALDPEGLLHTTYCQYIYEHHHTLKEKWLIPPDYRYRSKAWYKKAKEAKKGVWSSPYFDKGGGEVFMSTFSTPFFDTEKHFIGVVTADVKISVLSKRIQKLTRTKSHFVYLLDREGFLLSHPDRDYALKQSAFAYATSLNSPSLREALHKILSQKQYHTHITMAKTPYTLYSTSIPDSDLKIAVFLNDNLLYQPLHSLKKRLLLIVVTGMILMFFMLMFILRQFKDDIEKKTKMKEELALAAEIQIGFLPKAQVYRRAHFTIHTYFQAAKEVGGDLYGYKELESALLFYVGDVSGKGIPAALFMMATQIVLENTIEITSDPAKIITLANQKLMELNQSSMFVTLLVIHYDFNTQELTFCNAGHPSFLLKTQWLFSPLATFHPPLNTFANLSYTHTALTINTPFSLLCFSDGITEAENKKRELFGIERVARSVENTLTIEALRQEVEHFVDGKGQNDDRTVLLLVFN